jgi:hypothetical protein
MIPLAERSPPQDPRRVIGRQNWPDYDAALIRRESLTLRVTDEALAAWKAPVTGKRGGQPVYADVAIALRLVYERRMVRDREVDAKQATIDLISAARWRGGLTTLLRRVERNEPPSCNRRDTASTSNRAMPACNSRFSASERLRASSSHEHCVRHNNDLCFPAGFGLCREASHRD